MESRYQLEALLARGEFGTFQPQLGIHLRYAHFWTDASAPKGHVVLANGRSEFIEKYVEVYGLLLDRGWSVSVMDWRGQGLSTRLLPNRHKGHIDSFDAYLSDFDAFVAGVVDPVRTSGKLVLLGHSMGCHIGLRYLSECSDKIHFDRAVFSSPMVGVETPIPEWLVLMVGAVARRVGLDGLYAAGGDYGIRYRTFNTNLLTRDPKQFQRTMGFIDANPELAIGGLTVGWLCAALRSMRLCDQPGYFTKAETPVLMVCAENDQRVSNSATQDLGVRLEQVSVVTILDAEHELMMERDSVRSRFWSFFDDFVGRAF